MPVTPVYLSYVLEQLAAVPALASRRMFGGVGLYSGALFFGLIDDDALYLRVDDTNRPDYLARGMPPFRPFKDKPDHSMSYYEVPADVLEDVEQLAAWARRSVAAAGLSRRSRAQGGRLGRGKSPADRTHRGPPSTRKRRSPR